MKRVMMEKLLSKQTVNKLDAAVTKENTELLRKNMEKLFMFKNIFSIHDDHLMELAEVIIDLAKSDNMIEYAENTEQYVRKKMFHYHERKSRLVSENQYAKAVKNFDKTAMLDLTYQLWVYEEGYRHSEYQMLTIMNDIIQSVLKYGKEDMK